MHSSSYHHRSSSSSHHHHHLLPTSTMKQQQETTSTSTQQQQQQQPATGAVGSANLFHPSSQHHHHQQQQQQQRATAASINHNSGHQPMTELSRAPAHLLPSRWLLPEICSVITRKGVLCTRAQAIDIESYDWCKLLIRWRTPRVKTIAFFCQIF